MNHMSNHNIPGVSASIIKSGQVVWHDSYGTANFHTAMAVDSNTQFTLASISKLFTATACAQLQENNLLDLDADINTYLPITVVNPNFPNTPITARQLLTHKSSLKDSETDLQLWDALGDPTMALDSFCSAYFVENGSLYQASNFNNQAFV